MKKILVVAMILMLSSVCFADEIKVISSVKGKPIVLGITPAPITQATRTMSYDSYKAMLINIRDSGQKQASDAQAKLDALDANADVIAAKAN